MDQMNLNIQTVVGGGTPANMTAEEHVRALRELLSAVVIQYGDLIVDTQGRESIELEIPYTAREAIPTQGGRVEILSDPMRRCMILTYTDNPPSAEPAATPGRRRVESKPVEMKSLPTP